MNKLGVIAICGLALSAVSIGIAASIAAREGTGMSNMNFSWLDDDDDKGGCGNTGATSGSRSTGRGLKPSQARTATTISASV